MNLARFLATHVHPFTMNNPTPSSASDQRKTVEEGKSLRSALEKLAEHWGARFIDSGASHFSTFFPHSK